MTNKFFIISIVALAGLLFSHSLGLTHLFDWDEINFAESAREMIVTNNYSQVQINFEPFWEKPPLFIWLQVFCMKIFGINEFSARLPNALVGILTLSTLFWTGAKLVNTRFGILWVITYGCSFLPHLYFKSGIIDPWFNYLIFLSISFLLKNYTNRATTISHWYLELAGIALGLATLTKGPVAILIVGCTCLLLWWGNQKRFKLNIKEFLIFTGTALLIILSWFGFEIAKNGTWFVEQFISYQLRLASTEDAGHGGFWGYHVVVLLVGVFPASIFLFFKRKYYWESTELGIFRRTMWILLCVILLIFSLVQTKIVHYSSLAYFPISFLATYYITTILNERRISSIIRWLGFSIGLIWSSLFIGIVVIGKNPQLIHPFLKKDVFAYANLQASVDWPIYLLWPGVVLGISSIIFFYLSKNNRQLYYAILILFTGSVITIQGVITFFVPRIEKYSQAAAIQFYKEKSKENVPIVPLYFKTYAPYFYGKVSLATKTKNVDSLIRMGINPCYVVTKNIYKPRVQKEYWNYLELIEERNGFVFYRKKLMK